MEKPKAIFISVIAVFAIGLFLVFKQKSEGAISTPDETTQQETSNIVSVDEIGMSFEYPLGFSFRKEIAGDEDIIRSVGFYVENDPGEETPYMLYGLYQFNKDATKEDLQIAKTEMDPETIKEIMLDGYEGIEGLVTGPKTRYTTVILKDAKLFSISTIPPTQENKELTDQIIATFDFE